MKGFAIHNAPTDHGGIIPSTLLTMLQEDNAFVRAGDGHYCPKCKCWSTVVKSHDHMMMFGQPVAYVGDKLTCGAIIQPQQTHVVGNSNSSDNKTRENNNSADENLKKEEENCTKNNSSFNNEKQESKDDICFCNKEITKDILDLVLPKGSLFSKSKYPKIKNMSRDIFLLELNKAFEKFEINTCLRKAHFLAHVICESAYLKTTEEYYNEKVWSGYGGGSNYHGRGLLQLTHKKNYELFSNAIGEDLYSENKCGQVASEPKYVLLSAAWYWVNGSTWKNGNPHADKDDLHFTTVLINGGFNGYCERKSALVKLLKAMKVSQLCNSAKSLKKIVGEYKFEESDLMKSKVGKQLWIKYHTNPKYIKHVSCEVKGNI